MALRLSGQVMPGERSRHRALGLKLKNKCLINYSAFVLVQLSTRVS